MEWLGRSVLVTALSVSDHHAQVSVLLKISKSYKKKIKYKFIKSV